MAIITVPHDNLTDQRKNPWRDFDSVDEIYFVSMTGDFIKIIRLLHPQLRNASVHSWSHDRASSSRGRGVHIIHLRHT